MRERHDEVSMPVVGEALPKRVEKVREVEHEHSLKEVFSLGKKKEKKTKKTKEK